MIRDDLPLRPLADLPGGAATVVLCPTARLAAGLRRAHGEAQAARGAKVWAALNGATPAQWLDHLVSAALLRGEIPAEAVSGVFLTRPQERCLWEQAVAADEAIDGGELFDRAGMALAAMEADALRAAWRLEVPVAARTDEFRAFERWRARVAEQCDAAGWRTATAAMAWRIDCVARGIGGLPARLGIAGAFAFNAAPDPLLARLLAVLDARGVELFRVDLAQVGGGAVDIDGEPAPPRLGVRAALDAEDECRAAAAWVRRRLHAAPQARLRIAVADWPARRPQLEAALEDALHPDAVGAGWATLERAYAPLAGTPLADAPPVATALRLLPLFAQPRRIAQADFGALLCAPGWSADVAEAEGRARLDALLRERLPPETTLERLRRAVQRLTDTSGTPQLRAHLDRLAEAQRAAPGRLLPGAWGERFLALLDGLGWPGQRPPLAAEQAACAQFAELLAGLATLDAVVGRVDAATALRLAQRMCRDLSFAAPRRRAPAVELCGLDEAASGPVDGLWLLGMNEGVWPPAPRPNPLLPAEIQRRAGIPAARADLLAAQAREWRTLWCASAPEVIFSWARSEGERALRPSPLLADLPAWHEGATPGRHAHDAAAGTNDDAPKRGHDEAPARADGTPASAGDVLPACAADASPERIAGGLPAHVDDEAVARAGDEMPERIDDQSERVDDELLERVDDARAPPVGEAERIRGGTALLQAQAVCPAWGFYQFRLGAAVLPAPTFGLDARARGGLLHGALEAFWRGRDLAWLRALTPPERVQAIAEAVASAFADYAHTAVESLPPRLATLEGERLAALLATWLDVEAARADFRVLACEAKHELDIEGLPVRVVIDRIDELADGRLVIVDYKSGRSASAESWADPRPSEPQLPIYAALAFPDQAVAAVVLARVIGDEPAFLGVAESEGLLPGVKTLDGQRRRYAETDFPDWATLRAQWAERIAELAREVRDGVAAVVFNDEQDIAYCDVKPLLRVAERRQQWERLQNNPPGPLSSNGEDYPPSPLSGKGGDGDGSPAAPAQLGASATPVATPAATGKESS